MLFFTTKPATHSVCLPELWAVYKTIQARSNSLQHSWFKPAVFMSYRTTLAWNYFWNTTCLLDIIIMSLLQLVGHFWWLHWWFVFSNLGYSDGNLHEVALSPSSCSGYRWGRGANHIVSVTVENYCQCSFKPRQSGFMFNMSAYFGSPSDEAGNPCWISDLPVETRTALRGGEASSVLA